MVEHHVAAGRLKKLEVADRDEFSVPIYVVHQRGREPGRAGRWLIVDLRERVKTCPSAYRAAKRDSRRRPQRSDRRYRARLSRP